MKKFLYAILIAGLLSSSANILDAMRRDRDSREDAWASDAARENGRADRAQEVDNLRRQLEAAEKRASRAERRLAEQTGTERDGDEIQDDAAIICDKIVNVILFSSSEKPPRDEDSSDEESSDDEDGHKDGDVESFRDNKKWMKASTLLKNILAQGSARNVARLIDLALNRIVQFAESVVAGDSEQDGDDADADGPKMGGFAVQYVTHLITGFLRKASASDAAGDIVGSVVSAFNLNNRYIKIERYWNICMGTANPRILARETGITDKREKRALLRRVFQNLGLHRGDFFPKRRLGDPESDEEDDAAASAARPRFRRWNNFSSDDLSPKSKVKLRTIFGRYKAKGLKAKKAAGRRGLSRQAKQNIFSAIYSRYMYVQPGGRAPDLRDAIIAFGRDEYRAIEPIQRRSR